MQIDAVGLRRDGWIDLDECKLGAVEYLVSAASRIDAAMGTLTSLCRVCSKTILDGARR
jgi:hypothetical protein